MDHVKNIDISHATMNLLQESFGRVKPGLVFQ